MLLELLCRQTCSFCKLHKSQDMKWCQRKSASWDRGREARKFPIPTCCQGEEYQPDTMLYNVCDGHAPLLQASSRSVFGFLMFLHLLWGKVINFPWMLFSPHFSSRFCTPGPQEAEHCKGKGHLLNLQRRTQIKGNVLRARDPKLCEITKALYN